MDGVIVRRRCMASEKKGDEWEVLIHNSFDTYTNYKSANGNTFVIKDDGDWVEIVSNGKNDNNSSLALKNLYTYEDIKDKTCRLTWEFECNDLALFTETGAGNITFDFFSVNPHTGAAWTNRVSKLDFASLTRNNLIGRYSLEFVPSEYLASIKKGAYLGWHIGFRSTSTALTWRIMELTFEVHE